MFAINFKTNIIHECEVIETLQDEFGTYYLVEIGDDEAEVCAVYDTHGDALKVLNKAIDEECGISYEQAYACAIEY